MRHHLHLALTCTLLATQACADLTGPEPTLAAGVPASIVVPLRQSSHEISGSVTAQRMPIGSLMMRPSSSDEEIPPEYLQTSPLIGYTTVDFVGREIAGYAEMSFYATDASQTMTLTSAKDGEVITSASFSNGVTWLLPMGGTIGLDGLIPAPTCGATALGSTAHTAEIMYKATPNGSDKVTSNATPRYQMACPATSVTREEGSGYDETGTMLIICTTTEYYSASGEYLYDTRTCRTETYMT